MLACEADRMNRSTRQNHVFLAVHPLLAGEIEPVLNVLGCTHELLRSRTGLLRALKRTQPGLYFVDERVIDLPAFHELKPRLQVPVVLITNAPEQPEADAILRYPFNTSDVVDAMERALNPGRPTRRDRAALRRQRREARIAALSDREVAACAKPLKGPAEALKVLTLRLEEKGGKRNRKLTARENDLLLFSLVRSNGLSTLLDRYGHDLRRAVSAAMKRYGLDLDGRQLRARASVVKVLERFRTRS